MREMKKLRSLLLLAAVLVMGLAFTMTAEAAQPKLATLRSGKTYKSYDITGDGKKDKVKLRLWNSLNDGMYTKNNLEVKINGKSALRVSRDWADMDSAKLQICKLSNGRVFVNVTAKTPDGDGVISGLYKYQKGKLVKQIDFIRFFRYGMQQSGEIASVSGNTMKLNTYVMSWSLGPIHLQHTLKYKGGKMAFSSRTGKMTTPYAKTYLTASRNIQMYKTATGSSKAFVLKKGKMARITNCYVNKTNIRFKAKLPNGKTGWFKAAKHEISSQGVFDECQYVG